MDHPNQFVVLGYKLRVSMKINRTMKALSTETTILLLAEHNLQVDEAHYFFSTCKGRQNIYPVWNPWNGFNG